MDHTEPKLAKRLDPTKWDEIRKRYEAGEQSKALAAEYQIRPETLARRAVREGWKKASVLKAEAVAEFHEEVKRTWRERVEEATEMELKVYKLGASICIELLRDLKAGKCAGKKAYEARVVLDGLKTCMDGIRTALGSDNINLFDEANRDQTAIERLNEIFEESRKHYAQADSKQEAETDQDELTPQLTFCGQN